jgi:hypothetical protein
VHCYMYKCVTVKQSTVHFLGLNTVVIGRMLSIPGGKCNVTFGGSKTSKTVFEAFGSIHF